VFRAKNRTKTPETIILKVSSLEIFFIDSEMFESHGCRICLFRQKNNEFRQPAGGGLLIWYYRKHRKMAESLP